MSMKVRRRRIDRSGFTLIEILLVLVIIAVVAGLAVVNIGGATDTANRKAATAQVATLRRAVQTYYLNLQSYPSDLSALYTRPSELGQDPNWEPVLDAEVSADPWGTPYQYQLNGSEFEIRSAGKDRQFGTADDIFK